MWESHCETKHKKRVSRGFSVHSSENTIWHHKTASLWNIWASCLFRFSFSVCNCCRMTYLNEMKLLFLSFFWHLLIIDEKIEVCVKYSSAQLKTGNSWAGFVQNRLIDTSENLWFLKCATFQTACFSAAAASIYAKLSEPTAHLGSYLRDWH